jgi:type I restriction enzyme M protein
MAGKKYKKADEVRIEGNKIFSPERHKWLTLTPEEQVRQQYLTVLIDEFGFRLERI